MISRRSIMRKLVFLLAIWIALFPSFSKASLEVWRGLDKPVPKVCIFINSNQCSVVPEVVNSETQFVSIPAGAVITQAPALGPWGIALVVVGGVVMGLLWLASGDYEDSINTLYDIVSQLGSNIEAWEYQRDEAVQLGDWRLVDLLSELIGLSEQQMQEIWDLIDSLL